MPKSKKYLLTFSYDGEYYAELADIQEIAQYVGFSDVNEFENFKAFIFECGFPKLVVIHKAGCEIFLTDDRGVVLDSAEYPEH